MIRIILLYRKNINRLNKDKVMIEIKFSFKFDFKFIENLKCYRFVNF